MSRIMRKPVLGICGQVWCKSGCTATEDGKRLEILDLGTKGIALSMWAATWENRIFAYAKTKTQISFAVTAKLISAFVFATRIVQCLSFLNTKFQASSHFLWLYSPVCVGPGRKPRRPVFWRRGSISDKEKWLICTFVFAYAKNKFSHDTAHMLKGSHYRLFCKYPFCIQKLAYDFMMAQRLALWKWSGGWPIKMFHNNTLFKSCY